MSDLALCYVTRARHEILVSLPAEFDVASVRRVPAATVEALESSAEAAIRGARALTGLTDLTSAEWIGRRDHGVVSPGSRGAARRDFYWFEAGPETPDAWIHRVTADATQAASVVRLQFVPIEGAGIDPPMAALLPRLCERLSCGDVAVCYITRGSEILVFDGHPGGGVQVVAGGVDAGETPERAAVREAFEEAGLTLAGGDFLGTQEWHHRSRVPSTRGFTDVHELRHYYWFRVAATAPDAWQHRVSAGDADAGRVFHHRFVPAASAPIDWDLDAYLPAVLDRLA